jgi:hypothetical protein
MPSLADITAEYERALRVEQPSTARASAPQLRALRAIAGGDRSPKVPLRTLRIIRERGWIEWGEKGREITAAGLAEIARSS